MKTALTAAAAATLALFALGGKAAAQTEATPAPGAAAQPLPGIIVTPPRTPAPPVGTEQSCPDTGHKLELVV